MTYCIHNADFVPHWNNEDNLGIIAELVGQDGLRTFLVENLGLDPERPVTEVFNPGLIRNLLTSPRKVLDYPIRHVFAVVDPCGGSIKDYKDRPSDFAVWFVGAPGFIILGGESIGANQDEDYEDRLIDSLKRIMAQRFCQSARIVVDVETGTGFTAGHVHKLIKENFSRVAFMSDYDNKPGRVTNYQTKAEMAQLTNALLAKGDVRISSEFVTSHDDPSELLDMFRDQMLGYTRNVKETNSGTMSVTYTGKANGRKKDDLAVTFQRAVKAIHDFFKQQKYAPYWT